MSAEYSVPSQSSGTQYMPTGKSRSVNNGSKSPAPVMTHESLLTMRSSGSATARVFTIEASGRYSSPTSVSAIAALSSSTSGARAARGGIGFEKVGAVTVARSDVASGPRAARACGGHQRILYSREACTPRVLPASKKFPVRQWRILPAFKAEGQIRKIPKFHGPFLAYLKQSRVDCYSNTVGIHAHSPSMFTLVTRHSSTFARFECIPRVVNASCALGTRFPTSVSARDAKISHARRHPLGNTQR